MLPVRKSSRRIDAAKSAHSDAQRKRAKVEEAAEWSEASEDTEPMMVKGTVLTLDSKTASGKGLEGNKRNLGYYQSDNEVEVVGLFTDPTTKVYVTVLHFKHVGATGQMKNAISRVLWIGPAGPLRFKVVRAAPLQEKRLEKDKKRKGAPGAGEVEPLLVTSRKTAAGPAGPAGPAAPAAPVPAPAPAPAARAAVGPTVREGDGAAA